MSNSDPMEAERELVEQWIDHAANEINSHGLQNEKALLFEIQQTVNRLSELESLSETLLNESSTVDEELDTLGGLLLQFYAAHHNRESITDAIEKATDSDTSGVTGTQDAHTHPTLETDEEAVRERAEELIEQGVSSVSRITKTIMTEFDRVDRGDVSQIAAEVRSQAGEMETLGDPDDYPTST